MEIFDKDKDYDAITKYYKYNDNEIIITGHYNGYCIIINGKVDISEDIYDSTVTENFKKAYKIANEKFDNLIYISDKQKIIEYIEEEQKLISARNMMGCSEDWYNPFYAIKQTFSKEEIEMMSDNEINNILRITRIIQEGLY